MNPRSHFIPALFIVSALSFAGFSSADPISGKIEFLATTNVKMFKFNGEAKKFSSKVERKGLALSSLEVRIPVEELKTGMEVRDKHMKERIFTATDNSMPDIVFRSTKSACAAGPDGAQKCELPGTLAFRGVEHPYKLVASVTDSGQLHVTGHALIDVIEYGVQPAQLKWANLAVDRNAVVDIDVTVQ